MSSTATVTLTTQSRAPQSVLADYALHHSGDSRAPIVPDATPRLNRASSPPAWDITHRRVPQYRPIDRERDQSQIRTYNNTVERVFITTMFMGVYINSAVAKISRSTLGGSLSESIFGYRIGGEL